MVKKAVFSSCLLVVYHIFPDPLQSKVKIKESYEEKKQ